MLIRCGTKLRLLGGRRFIWQVLSPSPELSKPWQNEAIQACADAIDSGCTQVGLHVYGDTYFPSLLLNLLDRIIQQPSPESSPAQPDMRPRTPQVLVLAARMDRAIEIASTIGFNRRRWHIERDTALQKRPSQATVLVSTYPLAVQDDYQHQRLLKRIDLSTLAAIVLTDTEIFQEEPWVVDPPDLPQTPVVYFNDFRGRFLARPRWFAPFKQHSPLVIATTTKGVADLNLLRRLGVEVVYQRTLLDSLAEEWECKPRFVAIPVHSSQSSPSPESTSDSDSTESFSKAICSPEILRATVKAWQDHAAEIRKSTLVYCVDDAHASELEKVFRASDIDARQHKRTDGHKIMDEWSAGKFPILIVSHSDTVWVSRIDCVVLATPPTKNSELYGNRLLSAMSASPETGKEDSLVIELLDPDGSPQTDTCDIRTLLQLDASEISGQPLDVLQARAVQLAHLALPAQLDERRRIRKPHTPLATPIVMTTRTGSLHWYQLKEEAEDEDFYYIRKLSPGLHWVRCRIGVTPFSLSDS
ncbi:hypothetical protein B0H16DRAFT_1531867 [Mycena metata]|uniref:Helicase C-terminal domain-containing protein n=1 Tax=Mycena metata TaxID=1033252 RepID=A0AAD7JF45_9AGAR|nr:hypothetical protein B0H16DRAFT_1531867 [Mycena metata]